MSHTDEVFSLHHEAIIYAKRGIPVFPLLRNRDIPVPVVKWAVEATTDLDQIDKWWIKNPEYNIGILTGKKSGIVVLKFLTPEALAIAQEKGLPVAPMVKKGKGCYVYCSHQEGIENMLNHQDYNETYLLGEGDYVIMPPSVIGQSPPSAFQKADICTWVDGKGLDDLELGDVPEWMLDRTLKDVEAIMDTITIIAEDVMDIADNQPDSIAIQEEMQDPEVVEAVTSLDIKIDPTSTVTEVLPATDAVAEKECDVLPDNVEDWKSPLLFGGIGVEEIKAELLPSWLGEYALAVSQSIQTPEGLAVMIGLSAVATCVQKRFEVSPYGDNYVEPLSLWTVTVLPPSERKSPVLKAMTAPIYAWEKEQAEELKVTIDETATQIQIAQKRIEKLRQQAANETEQVARQRLVSEISEIQTSMPTEVRAPRLWVGDTTAESLQDLLAENDEKMAVLSDEGGIFEVMAGLYNDSKVNMDIFLQAYSGSPSRIKRKSRYVSLDRPALTFGLTVQPVVIEGFANGSKKQFRGKGALGRFLFCIPESRLGKRLVGQRIPVPPDIKSRYETGIKGLLSVPKVVDDKGVEMTRMLELDAAGLDTWEDFDRRVEGMLGPNGELAAMGDWGGKLPGTALRIAGILHLVENGPDRLTIGKDTLDRAVGLCNLLIGHTKAAFGLIGTDDPVSDAKRIFQWMQARGFELFTRTECNRELKNIDKERLDKALKELEKRNILKELLVPTAGRSASNYISNPILKPTFG